MQGLLNKTNNIVMPSIVNAQGLLKKKEQQQHCNTIHILHTGSTEKKHCDPIYTLHTGPADKNGYNSLVFFQ